jgi:hypothetical protein
MTSLAKFMLLFAWIASAYEKVIIASLLSQNLLAQG